jgi:vancomycin resistance protein VanW
MNRLVPLPIRVAARRMVRTLANRWKHPPFAKTFLTQSSAPLKSIIIEDQRVIVKQWEGSDARLQQGKRVNLELAAPFFDGLVIRPGEIFSFYHVLRNPTAKRGFLPGYEVVGQRLGEGVGGGLCQLATSFLWVMLHAGFAVVERHHHSYDLFPDHDRRVPFGTGASVFFNYHDLRMKNVSDIETNLSVTVRANLLSVKLSSSIPWTEMFTVEERNHRFARENGAIYRLNDIYRVAQSRDRGPAQLLWRNRARVLYPINI